MGWVLSEDARDDALKVLCTLLSAQQVLSRLSEGLLILPEGPSPSLPETPPPKDSACPSDLGRESAQSAFSTTAVIYNVALAIFKPGGPALAS